MGRKEDRNEDSEGENRRWDAPAPPPLCEQAQLSWRPCPGAAPPPLSPHLAEQHDAVPARVQLLQQPVQNLQLAARLHDALVCGGGCGVGEGGRAWVRCRAGGPAARGTVHHPPRRMPKQHPSTRAVAVKVGLGAWEEEGVAHALAQLLPQHLQLLPALVARVVLQAHGVGACGWGWAGGRVRVGAWAGLWLGLRVMGGQESVGQARRWALVHGTAQHSAAQRSAAPPHLDLALHLLLHLQQQRRVLEQQAAVPKGLWE